jgi:threonine/homoserine/homoserine lactone efflux protein
MTWEVMAPREQAAVEREHRRSGRRRPAEQPLRQSSAQRRLSGSRRCHDVGVEWSMGLPAFALAVVVIWSVPGPAMLLVVRRAALRGTRSALATVAGLGAGLYVWALAAAAGLGAVVAASAFAYDVVRLVGAVLLVVLGARALREAWRHRGEGEVAEEPERVARRHSGWAAFSEGLLVQLANPKIAVFLLAFYPQFIPTGAPVLSTTAVLALVQVVLETLLYLPVLAGVARARAWLQRSVVRRWLEVVSATVLVALGLRVAATSR